MKKIFKISDVLNVLYVATIQSIVATDEPLSEQPAPRLGPVQAPVGTTSPFLALPPQLDLIPSSPQVAHISPHIHQDEGERLRASDSTNLHEAPILSFLRISNKAEINSK
jgi:hypothetical protein